MDINRTEIAPGPCVTVDLYDIIRNGTCPEVDPSTSYENDLLQFTSQFTGKGTKPG
jgi:hypothetical protein